MDPHADDHAYCSPDPKAPNYCFTAKMRYIRANGGITLSWGEYGSREQFHGDSIRERARRTVDQARANGLDPVNVGSRWV